MTENTKSLNSGPWTDEQIKTLKNDYDPSATVETVNVLMERLNRSKRSIVGKLVSLSIYQAPEKVKSEKKDTGPTKQEIMDAIGDSGYDTDGLDGATKPALQTLQSFIASAKGAD